MNYLSRRLPLCSFLALLVFLSPDSGLAGDGVLTLDRASGTKLRVVSYNVFFSSVFPNREGAPHARGINRVENFNRVAKALDADIWALQEVLYTDGERKNRSAEDIQNYLSTETGVDFFMSADNKGRMILSRYPILRAYKVFRGVYAALIDLPSAISDKDIFVISAHLHYRDEKKRMEEGSQVAQFIRDLLAGNVEGVPSDSHLLFCGDLNSTQDDYPYQTIIACEPKSAQSGEGAAVFTDLSPVHLGGNSRGTCGAVTFQGDESQVVAKTIDFILIRPGSIVPENSYVFNTLTLPKTLLDKYGLQKMDVALEPNGKPEDTVRFDHLPLVADFSFSK